MKVRWDADSGDEGVQGIDRDQGGSAECSDAKRRPQLGH